MSRWKLYFHGIYAILINPDFLDTLFYLYGRLALQLEYGFYPVCGFLILGAARYRTYSNFRSVGITSSTSNPLLFPTFPTGFLLRKKKKKTKNRPEEIGHKRNTFGIGTGSLPNKRGGTREEPCDSRCSTRIPLQKRCQTVESGRSDLLEPGPLFWSIKSSGSYGSAVRRWKLVW